MRRTQASTGARDNTDVRFAIDQFARLITNADAKGGLLGAALAVLVDSVGQQGRAIAHRLPPASTVDWAALLALLTGIAAIGLSVAFLVRAVVPRIERSGGFSRYSWPSVVVVPTGELVAADELSDREHGWRTAKIMASIAGRKFESLRWAFLCWVLGTVALLVVALLNLGR
jgi:hypothetical protein